ncbi:peptidoglycan DD-metalloendopeptidase family protein [Dongshaea marina]|uniref:peptidoglycan DD-metalloendopeptidase family protein n=1 Tax=Dongshaea marina TaxID=2047966 RepID=UPI000D3E4E7A|nr:peptidoglycan DD-metalloendopeptidase family protein [Dongshaea marina]
MSTGIARRYIRQWLVLLITLGLVGCASNGPAPVSSVGPVGGYWRVQPGDTLYSIAWGSGKDFQEIARYNKISAPYNIYPGQLLRLTPKVVASSSGYYKVRKGDTLYGISRKLGVSASRLAALNGLRSPYRLYPGQKLNLVANGQPKVRHSSHSGSSSLTKKRQVTSSSSPKTSPTPAPVSSRKASSSSVKRVSQPASRKAVAHSSQKIKWSWPASGPIIASFSLSETGNKGIDIGGKLGQPIYAAASGVVVYAGSALRGYGKLIIIKHNDDYLSAYAHNAHIRVKEQQKIKVGQRIADMGNTGAVKVALHFEIRYRGKSVNPIRFLPKR